MITAHCEHVAEYMYSSTCTGTGCVFAAYVAPNLKADSKAEDPSANIPRSCRSYSMLSSAFCCQHRANIDKDRSNLVSRVGRTPTFGAIGNGTMYPVYSVYVVGNESVLNMFSGLLIA